MPESIQQRPSGRSFLPDLLKATGCVLIVLHHLAFYGPMSDVVAQHWPATIDWLADHGRLAVQIFLVCSGYLTAAALQLRPVVQAGDCLRLAGRRYLRLSIPLLAALSVAVLVTEWIRPEFDHPSLSATPQWIQMLAHVFFMQHLADLEALSAGVWYVAIDWQLYLITLLAYWAVTVWSRWYPDWRAEALRLQVLIALTALSLLHWNLQPDLDLYGLYFFGAYGMGWLAHRARRSRIPPKGWVLLLSLGLFALWVDPRWRIATAWGAALLLAAAPQRWLQPAGSQTSSVWQGIIHHLARVSYSVFLIHYAVMLAVGAWITARWPGQLLANAAGMLAALLLSLLAGGVLYRLTEAAPQTMRRWWFWAAVFALSTTLARHLAASG